MICIMLLLCCEWEGVNDNLISLDISNQVQANSFVNIDHWHSWHLWGSGSLCLPRLDTVVCPLIDPIDKQLWTLIGFFVQSLNHVRLMVRLMDKCNEINFLKIDKYFQCVNNESCCGKYMGSLKLLKLMLLGAYWAIICKAL